VPNSSAFIDLNQPTRSHIWDNVSRLPITSAVAAGN
jgi:hypothetical protein